MKMKNVAKNFGLCMIGFIGGSIVTGYGVLKLLTKTEKTLIGLKEDVVDGVEILLFGGKRSSSYYRRRPRVSYSYYNPYSESYTDINDIEFSSREEAEKVITAMEDIVVTYGFVTVADYLDLINVKSKTYKDTKYGWTDVHANITKVRGKYHIIFKYNPKEVF